jgi:prevent-host-death family protein
MPVAIRELKAHLSAHLRRARDGEPVVVTDHGVPCAVILPYPPATEEDRFRMLYHQPGIQWTGRATSLPRPVRLAGASLAGAVREGRE